MIVIKIVCETEYKFESFLAPNASFNKSVIQPLASKSATTYKWYMCSLSNLDLIISPAKMKSSLEHSQILHQIIFNAF